ncbi:MAG TPA: hypothetical protein VM165_07065 [Planctomycetaceae bacterium]|nr:hypothetical protein [Planctomycetaceae bacterium]
MHEAIEAFCVDFRREFKAIWPQRGWAQRSPEERRKHGDESLLEELLRVSKCGNLKKSVHFATVEYYRLVRNATVHGSRDDDDRRRLQRQQRRVKARIEKRYQQDTGKSYNFQAPNDIDSLNFDDVRLFGWAASRIAASINSLLDVEGQALVDAVFSDPGGKAFRRSYRMLQKTSKEERLRHALRLRLVDRFGLTDAESSQILATATMPLA